MLEMPELIKEWKKVSYAPLFFGYLGTATNQQCRLGNGPGQGTRNKRPDAVGGSRDVFRLYQYHVQHFQQSSGPKVLFTGTGDILLSVLAPVLGMLLCLILHHHSALLGCPSGQGDTTDPNIICPYYLASRTPYFHLLGNTHKTGVGSLLPLAEQS